jgi:monofunctional biosynthetic peptidoglycan transglycosylase
MIFKKKKKSIKEEKNRTWVQKILRLMTKAMLWFFGLSTLIVLIFKFVPVPITPLMVIRVLEQKMEGKEAILSHTWVPIEDISMNLQKAVIASEDQKFLTHYGFDVEAIQKARKSNAKGKRLRGGSTISQQTAKNVFLWPGRSYIRKGLEAYFTLLIEFIWGKERIMEVYLNSIEMGNGVYGVQEASRVWYRKEAQNLSKYEAAGIAAILPNPRVFKASNSSSYIERRKNRILRQMRYLGKLEY